MAIIAKRKEASAEVLRIVIDEQRREYDALSHMKDQVGVKTLTLAGAGLALLVFLYSDGDLFFPSELYGRVFYVTGALLTVGAVSALLYAVKPSGHWEFPPETSELQKLCEDEERKYLSYVKKRYMECWESNSRHYNKKQQIMNRAFYPLVFGAIILITIKIFGGQ